MNETVEGTTTPILITTGDVLKPQGVTGAAGGCKVLMLNTESLSCGMLALLAYYFINNMIYPAGPKYFSRNLFYVLDIMLFGEMNYYVRPKSLPLSFSSMISSLKKVL